MKYKTEDVINSISDFIIIVDDDRRIITTNKKLEEYIGINKLDLAGRIMCDVFTFYTNENKKSCPLIKALESDRSFNFNHKDYLFLLNGEKRLVEGSVGLIRANGSISGAIITFRDITDQVTTEAKLIENEKKFRKLYNSMVNSYTLRKVIYDDSGNPCDYLYLEVNDAFEKLVGKKRSEIIGKRYTELFPENQEFWINSYNHVTQLGESRVFEGYVPAVGKYLRTHVFMVTEDLNGFIAIDVTERKELELQLAKERRLFEELFTTLENAYALCEILGDEDNIDFKFIEVNPKFLKYVNKELEDIIDKKASELFTQTIKDDPTGTKKMLTAYYRAAKYGETQRFDIYSNLMERQIEVIAYGQGENRFAAEYIDISERKALQESLRAEKEKYAELFNSMNEGFVLLEKIFDENGEVRDLKISDINYAGEKILGKGLDEIFGKNASSFFDENCKDANASLAKLLEVSQRTYSKNDSIVKVNVKAFDKILEISTFNPSENMIAILFGDVTDQARLEEAIKHEREQLDLVFNTSLSAFALIEMIIDDNNKPIDYVFTKVNPQFLEVAKKEEDDIVGVRASKLYEVDVYRKDSMFHDYVKVFRTGEPISKEFYSLAYDAYLDISVIKIKDNTLAISFTDISEKKEMQDALHKNLAVLKQSQEIASIGSLELNIESNKILVSPEARRILGIQLDGNISFNTVYKLIHANDLDIINKNLEKARNAEINELDFRVRIFNNGETKNIHMKGEIRASSEGTKIYGVIQDISNIVRAQEQLSKNEAKFRAILSNTSDVVLIYDKDLNLLFNSANEAKILGWTDKELLERDSFTLLHPDDKDMVLDYMDQIITGDIGKNIEFEARVLTKSGEYIYTKNSMLNMIDNPDINGILVNYSDITEIKNREREIAYLSNYDALTGLYNRSYFERSYQEIDEEENMPISIVIGDLNGLKLINDTLGHSKGDEILATMAEIIRSTCKESYLPIRYGGDEYCIVLPNTSSEKAEKYIEKLKEKCREYKESGESEIFYPSIALGCATKETKEQALSSILRIAEDNMYKDKLYEKSSIHNADSLVLSIKAALHEKSFETEEHSARLAKFSTEIGEILGLMDYQLNELSYAAELHDIGKIGVDESILIKAGKLTESEWNKIKEHPEIGYRIAKAAPELNNIAEYILHHHERWDGTGYPFGIAGEDIPLYSRIISVIDAYDVMTSGRPYKAPMSSKEAVRELLENSGSQFDPKIVDIFVNVILL